MFARALSIGPETMVMRYRPDQPMHSRYDVAHDFLTPQSGAECITINRTVNAFFRWEFKSCEMLVKFGADGQPDQVYPIDYANACPDVAVTPLHYYFPWAMKALVKWSAYCLVTGRRPSVDLATDEYFAVADHEDLSYEDKLARYRQLADSFFEADQYHDWCDARLRDFDEKALEWFQSQAMDEIIVSTVRGAFPQHEHDRFIEHFRGLVGLWCHDEQQRMSGDRFVHG